MGKTKLMSIWTCFLNEHLSIQRFGFVNGMNRNRTRPKKEGKVQAQLLCVIKYYVLLVILLLKVERVLGTTFLSSCNRVLLVILQLKV